MRLLLILVCLFSASCGGFVRMVETPDGKRASLLGSSSGQVVRHPITGKLLVVPPEGQERARYANSSERRDFERTEQVQFQRAMAMNSFVQNQQATQQRQNAAFFDRASSRMESINSSPMPSEMLQHQQPKSYGIFDQSGQQRGTLREGYY